MEELVQQGHWVTFRERWFDDLRRPRPMLHVGLRHAGVRDHTASQLVRFPAERMANDHLAIYRRLAERPDALDRAAPTAPAAGED